VTRDRSWISKVTSPFRIIDANLRVEIRDNICFVIYPISYRIGTSLIESTIIGSLADPIVIYLLSENRVLVYLMR